MRKKRPAPKHYILMITRTIVQRNDVVKALAYKLFRGYIESIEELKKSQALKIVRDAIWWSGKTGWQGDSNSITDIIGEFEAFEDYVKCEKLAQEYVKKHFPDLTDNF